MKPLSVMVNGRGPSTPWHGFGWTRKNNKKKIFKVIFGLNINLVEH
jgi:hypothetical protein